jgi:phytoene/squalene synthetase
MIRRTTWRTCRVPLLPQKVPVDEFREDPAVSAESLAACYSIAEAIASRDKNNLYLSSRYFGDANKYRAFCALYAVMRVLDDRIDSLPSRAGLSATGRAAEHAVVDRWARAVEDCFAGREPVVPAPADAAHPDGAALLCALADAVRRFPVPPGLWRNFFAAMHRDIDCPRFATYREFLDYAEGATVAPTTIYLYLVASAADGAGTYRLPAGFDLLDCGRQLGRFAYLGHILRDLAADLATGDEGLLYLARDDMDAHGVSEETLFADLARKEASPPLRGLVADLVARARGFLEEGRRLMRALEGKLTPDCAFILELIVTIYREVIDRIEACGCDPLSGGHQLSTGDKKRIAFRLATRSGLFAAGEKAETSAARR